MALREILKDSSGVPTGDYKLVAGSTNFADNPIGSIIPYGGTTPPSGFLLCDGTAISRTTYAELFAVIGEAFGAGDGSTTFNLPDMRESVPKGAGLTGKSDVHYDSDGVALGEFVEDRIKSHTHNVPQFIEGSPLRKSFNTSSSQYGRDTDIISYATGSATNEVKSVGVNYIIKAKMIGVPADFLAKVAETNEYSTTETVVGKWINGKPIYRKCCVLTSAVSVSSASEWVNLLNKSTYGLENIEVITQGYVIRNANNGPVNALSLSPGSSSYIQAHREGITWELNVGSVIILEYTKTTD